MKDQLNLRVFTMNRSIWRGKMAKWYLVKYQPKLRVCMDWVDWPQNNLLQGFVWNFARFPFGVFSAENS